MSLRKKIFLRLILHCRTHEPSELVPILFSWNTAESLERDHLVDTAVDVGLEENLWQLLLRELLVLVQDLPPVILGPIVRLSEDVGEVEAL